MRHSPHAATMRLQRFPPVLLFPSADSRPSTARVYGRVHMTLLAAQDRGRCCGVRYRTDRIATGGYAPVEPPERPQQSGTLGDSPETANPLPSNRSRCRRFVIADALCVPEQTASARPSNLCARGAGRAGNTTTGKPVNEKVHSMLYTIAVVLLILWALGLVTSYTVGGFIHILLVVALIMILVNIISGRRSL